MTDSYNPLAFPVVLRTPNWLPTDTPIDGRLPLAMLVVAMLKPAQVVELGVGCGETYGALCQAVQELRLACQCLGIEWNTPDSATAEQRAAVVEFRSCHAARYGGFSRLAPGDGQGATAYVSDGSVDLLHLAAGLDNAEAAAALRQWLPKLSARGTVMVSNISPAENGQGLASFWAETKQAYPHFELFQGQGLGLLLVGAQRPESLVQLTQLPSEPRVTLQELLYRLGQAAAASAMPGDRPLEAHNLAAEQRRAEQDRALLTKGAEIASLNQTLREQTEHLDKLQGRLELVTAREREIRALYLDLHQQLLSRDQGALQFAEKDRVIAARDEVAAEKDLIIAARDEAIAWLQSEWALSRAEVASAQTQISAAADEAMVKADQIIAARDEGITWLRAELALAQGEIRTLHASRTWRLAMALQGVRSRLSAIFRDSPSSAQ